MANFFSKKARMTHVTKLRYSPSKRRKAICSAFSDFTRPVKADAKNITRAVECCLFVPPESPSLKNN